MRDAIFTSNLLERCVRDVRRLLLGLDAETDEDGADAGADIVVLWNAGHGAVAGGTNYADDSFEDVDW